MAQIKTNLQYGVTGSLQTANIAGDAIDGTKIADDAINSEHYAGTSVDDAHINDVASSKLTGTIATARLGSGTASSSTILYGDQTYKTEPTGYDVSSITGATDLAAHPEITDEINLSDGGTLKRLDLKYMISRPSWEGRFTSGFYASTGTESVLPMNSSHFDSDGCFNATSSSTTLNGLTAPAYSFTPHVAGYYYCFGVPQIWSTSDHGTSSLDTKAVYFNIRKNGSTHKRVCAHNVWRTNIVSCVLIQMNGTGDYIQFTVNPGTSFGSTQNFYAEQYQQWYGIFKVAGLPTTSGG
jgi:hypothetical protein